MSATIHAFPKTAGGRQCLRDHLEMVRRFGPFDHPDYKSSDQVDWDEIDRLSDEALAILNSREAAR